MVFSRRIASIAPVTPPRISRILPHFSASASLRQCLRDFGKQGQMHGGIIAMAGAIRLLRGERQSRGQPGGEAKMQNIQHAAAGAAFFGIRTVAIQAVLADIEIKRR